LIYANSKFETRALLILTSSTDYRFTITKGYVGQNQYASKYKNLKEALTSCGKDKQCIGVSENPNKTFRRTRAGDVKRSAKGVLYTKGETYQTVRLITEGTRAYIGYSPTYIGTNASNI